MSRDLPDRHRLNYECGASSVRAAVPFPQKRWRFLDLCGSKYVIPDLKRRLTALLNLDGFCVAEPADKRKKAGNRRQRALFSLLRIATEKRRSENAPGAPCV